MLERDQQYKIYEEATVALLRTMVIKTHEIGTAMNTAVETETGVAVNTENKMTWKYYLNMSGQYHAVDTMMYVDSHDSESTIPFTVSALAVNPVTKAAYQYGTQYYKELVAKYPKQEFLILGILNPVDIATAISAQNGTILAYQSDLVESQEIDLIDQLQDRISFFFNRWYNPLYTMTDEAYLSAFLEALYLHCIPNVLNLRLAACKTNQAHSFHVKQFLISKGVPAKDIPYLSLKQRFNLYRNIDKYLTESGQNGTLKSLVKLLLTDENIALYEYRLRHKVNELSRTLNDSSNILPQIAFDKRVFGTQNVTTSVTLESLNLLIEQSAPGNADYFSNRASQEKESLYHTSAVNYPTKVMEVELPASAYVYTRKLSEIMLSEWLSLATLDIYSLPVEITLKGQTTPTRLLHNQAVALWYYCMLALTSESGSRVNGTNPVPKLPVVTAIPETAISYSDLSQLFGNFKFVKTPIKTIQAALINRPLALESLAAFKSHCEKVQQMELATLCEIGAQLDGPAYAALTNARKYAYESRVQSIPGCFTYQGGQIVPITWSKFLSQIGVTLDGYTFADYIQLAAQIFNAATGSSDDIDLADVNRQNALVDTLKALLSYTVIITNRSVTSVPINVGEDQVFYTQEIEIVSAVDACTGSEESSLSTSYKNSFALASIVDHRLSSNLKFIFKASDIGAPESKASISASINAETYVETAITFGA